MRLLLPFVSYAPVRLIPLSLYFELPSFVRVKTGLLNGLLGLGFSLSYPPSLLYGGFVAATLGHELTHGFDSNGRMFDKDGFTLDWWEQEDEEAFDNRTACMVNFMLSYYLFLPLILRWISMRTSRFCSKGKTSQQAALTVS